MHAIDQLQDFFITYLEKQAITKEPENLYEHRLHIRNRWKAHSSSSNPNDDRGFNGDYKSTACCHGLRFSIIFLVHDDIMDDAPLRRGT
jgi:geranylgeranyl diphosphate synthase type II